MNIGISVLMPITKDEFVLIDPDDYQEIAKHNWYFQGNGHGHYYAARRVGNKLVFMHRIIMNAEDHQIVDHINRNTFDNRKNNLRLCTSSENSRNANKRPRKIGMIPYSQYKGVTWDKSRNKWVAQIRLNGKQINIGRFDDEINAAKEYNKAAIKYHGEFANLNEV